MKSTRMIIQTMACMVLPIYLIAQNIDVKKHPGFVDLDQIQIPKNAGEVTEVNIGPELFQMFANFMGEEDKNVDVMQTLNDFISIRVKSFEVDDEGAERVRPIMDKIEKQLKNENWYRVVQVKSGDEYTNVSVKFDKSTKKTMGLFIMSLDPDDEVSFVNIVGSVSLQDLGHLGNIHLNNSALDSLKDILDD